jgi:Phthiocerol/phthiodiolone dimycocerosyl transferase C-terminus
LAPRALSKVEEAFWLLDRSTSFNGVNTSFLRGPIEAEHVRKALEWVQARHELLRVAIRDAGFVTVEAAVPLRVVVGQGWQECEREEINARYQEGELLWRAVWVPNPAQSGAADGGALIISHQHVICDAQSAVLMARDIVNALGAIVEGRPLPPPQPLPMRAALTDLVKPGFIEKLGAMNAFFFRNLVLHGLLPARKLTNQLVNFPDRRLGVVHLLVNEEETARLAERCKAEETSVQGGLCAALLLAAAEDLGLDHPAWLGCFSAVSLHERAGVRDDMGIYISQVTTYHKVAKATNLWDLAREVKRDLQRALRTGEQLVTIPMIGMFIPRRGDKAARLAKKMDLASPATIGLSNIGRIELPRAAGPVSLERFHLAVGPSVVAPLAACAATLHGRLAMNLVYVEPLVPAERAKKLIERTYHHLQRGIA